MTKTPHELAQYLYSYNRWRRGSCLHEQPVPEELGKVLDQVIAILEEQAQPQTIFLSDCCQAKTGIGGRNSRGSTRWYVCTDCRKPCDVFIRTSQSQPQ